MLTDHGKEDSRQRGRDQLVDHKRDAHSV
jgi:hypothetical protein